LIGSCRKSCKLRKLLVACTVYTVQYSLPWGGGGGGAVSSLPPTPHSSFTSFHLSPSLHAFKTEQVRTKGTVSQDFLSYLYRWFCIFVYLIIPLRLFYPKISLVSDILLSKFLRYSDHFTRPLETLQSFLLDGQSISEMFLSIFLYIRKIRELQG
jgi:hypothetical protein